ncbi:DUF983 domain-containing protein [Sphingomonas sp. GlSt437]
MADDPLTGSADGSGPALPLVRLSLGGRCPRCGSPTLFAGMTRFAARCSHCGLDFSSFNVGDGPAAFLTLILGTVIVAAAITLELTVHPPLWVHAVVWLPVTLAAVIGSLRIAKAALIAVEYRQAAHEGRIAPRGP